MFIAAEGSGMVRGRLPTEQRWRIAGRYGHAAPQVLSCAKGSELSRIPGTNTLWVELRWAARHEDVLQLEDLLLRRTRLGLTLPQGGEGFLDRIGAICREELRWEATKWDQEVRAYRSIWQKTMCPREGLSPEPFKGS